MPKRDDIKKILLIGSGPIVIGQACEFDYSGTQACKALKDEGYEIILINSNPATIMTDPETADHTYIEPITPETLAKVIEKERPDALLPTLGGQTGLNTAVAVAENGVLDRFGVEMIGARLDVIKKAEDRELFKAAMKKIGLRVPASGIARSVDDCRSIAEEIGYPVIIRPSFTLGGAGGGVAYNREDLERMSAYGLDLSMIHEIMLEESIIGWKEFELELMRDRKDNVVIVCSIENIDPMGVHTGDSITVAPIQTLTDREYQHMRDAAMAIIREIGVDTGGSNIQFAVHPQTGEMVVIEMNPRVSRSSALASKATGYPIAKLAAKLAVGYTLDEIPNDITRETQASFEPTIDYCVVKIPRWTFEKFPNTDDFLTISMKSVGETMAIGRTFAEALQKGLRSLEIGRHGLYSDGRDMRDANGAPPDLETIRGRLRKPNSKRIFYLAAAFQQGLEIDEVNHMTGIDPWFLYHIRELVLKEPQVRGLGELFGRKSDPASREELAEGLYEAKRDGFSDVQLARLWNTDEDTVRKTRLSLGIKNCYKSVDTCAAEFEAYTPYYYSTYEDEDEVRTSDRKKVIILGGGPNRIGQGIEFDYCCVHASFALKEMGVESIMVNSNPETVSTDYDTSDRLYFEPLTKEDVLGIVEREKPYGVIVQFGGQTPLNVAGPLAEAGVRILGTPPDSIDRAEERGRFKELLQKLSLLQPPNGMAWDYEEARKTAELIGYPVVVRPSYVLGGRAMEIVYDGSSLADFVQYALDASPGNPVLIDKFLEDAIEIDVDAVSDGSRTIIGGIMEHIEEAGVHSGDSACVLPPRTLSRAMINEIKAATRALAAELGVVGLMNIQFAIKGRTLYVLEVNPRASRTVPFVSKATGVPLAKVATRIMLGQSLDGMGLSGRPDPKHISVKEAVFPFNRFPGVDTILGPEMKSTGEVMGIDHDFGLAYAKAQSAAGQNLPTEGTVFISVRDRDKSEIVEIASMFSNLGFNLVSTRGTAKVLHENGLKADTVNKVSEGRPHVIDMIKNNKISLIINTSLGKRTVIDSESMRRAALLYKVPYVTTAAGAEATALACAALLKHDLTVKSLQEYHSSMGVD
ncbi:MAG: carbamoyl-phosphate synthase large subunit [Deltaproteobacteria bacterium]|nr:carbamoyl-phosphate synthase large subunit [Deltaproteobacteria bacterium]